MNSDISALQPAGIWRNFKSLTLIPRPSKKEHLAVEFIKKFGRDHSLETSSDETGNVLIRKPATPGLENRKTIVFQSHLDMVPQKNNDKKHDFEKDPIRAIVDGEWVRADGTTLGSDNGIGVAAMLAVLESDELVHGPIEALFTVDEETGMTGAFALQPGFVRGDILLNLDSEHDGELFIGCAGGMDINVMFRFKSEPIPSDHVSLLLKVNGLKGGHSGIDINLGRGNSNQVMFRLLWTGQRSAGMRLCSVEGGNMRNAIPREAVAHVIVPAAREQEFLDNLKRETENIKTELLAIEPSLNIEVSVSAPVSGVMPQDFQRKLIAAVYACPNGPLRMTDGIPDLVETSTNLSVVRSEADQVAVHCLLRSSVDSAKQDLGDRMRALFEMAGAEVGFSGSYPGWKPNMDSLIMKIMVRVYTELFDKEPEIKAIHAGLECGIIGGTYPDLDMISFGPTIKHPHSPDEKVHIGSVERFWKFLVEILKQVPEKA